MDTDTRGYVKMLGLGNLSRKMVIFKSGWLEDLVTDLTEYTMDRITYMVVNDWIELERVRDGKASNQKGHVHVLSPIIPGMSFLDIERDAQEHCCGRRVQRTTRTLNSIMTFRWSYQ